MASQLSKPWIWFIAGTPRWLSSISGQEEVPLFISWLPLGNLFVGETPQTMTMMMRKRKEVWMIGSLKKPRSQPLQRIRNFCSRPWPANWPALRNPMGKLPLTLSKNSSTRSCRYSKSSCRNSSNLSSLTLSSNLVERSKINSLIRGTRGRKRRGRRRSNRSRNKGCYSRKAYPLMTTSMMTYTRCSYRVRAIREQLKLRQAAAVGREMRTRNLIISEVPSRRISPTTTYISSSAFRSHQMSLIWSPWI